MADQVRAMQSIGPHRQDTRSSQHKPPFFRNGPMHVQSGGIQIKRIWERRSLKFLSKPEPIPETSPRREQKTELDC